MSVAGASEELSSLVRALRERNSKGFGGSYQSQRSSRKIRFTLAGVSNGAATLTFSGSLRSMSNPTLACNLLTVPPGTSVSFK
jgi:hypothetical protein